VTLVPSKIGRLDEITISFYIGYESRWEAIQRVPSRGNASFFDCGVFIYRGKEVAAPGRLIIVMPIQVFKSRPMRIYDYFDSSIPMLEKMHRRRISGYRRSGMRSYPNRRSNKIHEWLSTIQ